jgi:hypothetical protein
MAEIARSAPVSLSALNPRVLTPAVPLGALTSTITVRLLRPTTAQPLAWDASSALRVQIVVMVDGVQYVCEGQTSGGIRHDQFGNEVPEYSITFALPVLFGDKARTYLLTAQKDAEGFYNDVPLTRLGELGSSISGYLVLERLRGTINTIVTAAVSTEAPSPLVRYKNSVAFDAATSAVEVVGDGVLSLSHTASGTDRAAFIGVGNVGSAGGSLGSVTYGGTSATELWDTVFGTDYGNAGYSFVAPPTSATTVTSTLVDTAPFNHVLGVVSFTGVDQTTPTGTAVTQESTGDVGVSVTVSDAVDNDLIVDNLWSRATTPVIGADQTQRNTQDTSWPMRFRQSTQPGNADDVMSWTFTGGGAGEPVFLGAVAFKTIAAAMGGGPLFGKLVNNPMLAGRLVL